MPKHLEISLKEIKFEMKKRKEAKVIGIILIIILVLLFIGVLPTWLHSKSWGPYSQQRNQINPPDFDDPVTAGPI